MCTYMRKISRVTGFRLVTYIIIPSHKRLAKSKARRKRNYYSADLLPLANCIIICFRYNTQMNPFIMSYDVARVSILYTFQTK